MQLVTPTEQQRGHGHRGPGSILRLTMVHHSFIFALYLDNPSMPLYGYVEELEIRFSLVVSIMTIHNWFMSIGPFKGTLRITSSFPSGRDSYPTYCLLCQYLRFIVSIDDHT